MIRRLWSVALVAVALLGPATAASAESGPQTFLLYQGPDEDNFTVYAAGPITGVGTDFLLAERVDPTTGRTQRDTETVFPGGSTFNTLTVLENSLQFDPLTCVARVTGRSHLDITGGTGDFEGASGSGEVTFQAISISARTPQGCSRSEMRTYAIARITGTADLP